MKKETIKKVVRILRAEHVSYDDTRDLFKILRKELDLTPPKRTQKVIKHLTREEIEHIINYSYKQSSKYGLMIKTLFFTGCRVSEFVNIKAEDVYFDDRKILIRKGKGAKERFVPIYPFLEQELRTYLGGRQVGFLFESNYHDKFSTRRIQQILKKVCETAGVNKSVYPHLLRHTIATMLLNNGMPMHQIQLMLGHSKIETTQHYARTAIGSMQKGYQKALGFENGDQETY